MTKIKSGAICLLFSYAWVLLCFFYLPVIWLSVLKEFLFLFYPFNIFSLFHLFHIFGMYCIRVRHRRRGSGAFWISVAICNIDFAAIKKFIRKWSKSCMVQGRWSKHHLPTTTLFHVTDAVRFNWLFISGFAFPINDQSHFILREVVLALVVCSDVA